jgi:hypothetical protein
MAESLPGRWVLTYPDRLRSVEGFPGLYPTRMACPVFAGEDKQERLQFMFDTYGHTDHVEWNDPPTAEEIESHRKWNEGK